MFWQHLHLIPNQRISYVHSITLFCDWNYLALCFSNLQGLELCISREFQYIFSQNAWNIGVNTKVILNEFRVKFHTTRKVLQTKSTAVRLLWVLVISQLLWQTNKTIGIYLWLGFNSVQFEYSQSRIAIKIMFSLSNLLGIFRCFCQNRLSILVQGPNLKLFEERISKFLWDPEV